MQAERSEVQVERSGVQVERSGVQVERGAVQVEQGAVRVDAAIIAEGLGLEPAEVLAAMRAGQVTSRLEQGSGEDEGRYRLTFLGEQGRLQIVVDEQGRVLRKFKLSGRRRPRARPEVSTS